MIEVIKNTLEIIGKMSRSSAGYLIKFNSVESKIISSFGEDEEVYKSFNDSLFQNHNSNKLNQNEIKNLGTFKNLIRDYSWNSFFVKKMISKEKDHKSYYMFLFSKEKENFEEENIYAVTPIINNLISLVKNFDISSEYSKEESSKSLKGLSSFLELKNNKFLKSFFDSSEDLVFILDQNGCFISVNDYGSACLDYEPKELLDTHFIELVASKNKAIMAKSFQKILEEDSSTRLSGGLVTFEAVLISKFGNEIIFQINCKAIREKEKILGLLGVGKNITELRSYEEKITDLNIRLIEANRIISVERQRSKRQGAILAELNKMKNEFISNVSHELRTPLASIIGFSETISSDPNMPEEMRLEFNEIILNEGKRLAKLINDVLDISRLEGGQIELVKSEFDIITLIEDAISANKKIIDSKEIILTKEMPPDNIIINADKEKILVVLNSLINNAAKFTLPKGRIKITAQNLYKELELTISDTGVGIPEKDIPLVFQKFYRVNRPGVDIPGTGLGLVFVKQIVDLHKGFITIQSEVNKGTTVIIKLPRESKV
ncbi:MAG: PAS domain-containing sensor histidine kinase [Bacteroidetes bacterium]|nr:PAS domain-containing sensor histidine kinase [Bacteroidota bacterium]